MSDIVTKAEAAKEAVEKVMSDECERIVKRAEKLRAIKTPSVDASSSSFMDAYNETTDYIADLGVAVA
jgi:hypothetical protein